MLTPELLLRAICDRKLPGVFARGLLGHNQGKTDPVVTKRHRTDRARVFADRSHVLLETTGRDRKTVHSLRAGPQRSELATKSRKPLR